MRVYRITPLEKKSISITYEMYRENVDNSISWFNIEDSYRWGQGFIDEDMDANLPYQDSKTAVCDPRSGWGAELDDSVYCEFEFSEDISEQEQEEIKQAYYEGGAAWLFDGEHEWQEEHSYIEVLAPFRVDLCESDGTVIKENCELESRPQPTGTTVAAAWPFTTIKE